VEARDGGCVHTRSTQIHASKGRKGATPPAVAIAVVIAILAAGGVHAVAVHDVVESELSNRLGLKPGR
jgi:hypothetical protein